jgi:hypothetical protein
MHTAHVGRALAHPHALVTPQEPVAELCSVLVYGLPPPPDAIVFAYACMGGACVPKKRPALILERARGMLQPNNFTRPGLLKNCSATPGRGLRSRVTVGSIMMAGT